MNRDTVIADLRARALTGYCFYEDPRGQAHVVVLSYTRDGYQTWIQDERAQLVGGSLRTFAAESEALGDFVHRVEIWNRISGVRPPAQRAL